MIGALAAKLANVKIVFSWETASHTNNVFHGSIQRRVGYRLAMKFVNKIIAVSGEVKKSLIEWRRINPAKIKVIHYGVDISKFNTSNKILKKKEIGVNGILPILGVVSRLQLEKGHIHLLQALLEIVKKFPDTKCIFVGSGSYRKELEKKVQMLHLEKNILFLGFRDDIAELLVMMDIFILPSLSEGMPNAVLEAMACSIPVVATSVGGIPEAIINRESGILVPPGDPQALAEQIINLLNISEFRKKIADGARERIKNYFSNDRQFMKFQTLYQSYIN
ncbi:MAG: glycosyltransferase [Bacteroidales bacterium]|nr:glycosyltransferase [Bacteroidales bacterium]